MAEVVFTEIALLHIRAMSATLPWAQPVVSVTWVKATVDNSRGTNGEIEWRMIDSPKWFAFVSDWNEISDLNIDAEQLPRIEGIAVHRDKKAQEQPGQFVITLTEKGLAVELSAT